MSGPFRLIDHSGRNKRRLNYGDFIMKDYINAYERTHDHLLNYIVIAELGLLILVTSGLVYLVW